MNELPYSGLGGRPGNKGAVQLAPNGMLPSGKIGKPGMDGFVKLNIKGVPASHPIKCIQKKRRNAFPQNVKLVKL